MKPNERVRHVLANLHPTILAALRCQERDTRIACAEAIAKLPEDMSTADFKELASEKCLTVEVD